MNFCIFAGLGEVKQQYIHSGRDWADSCVLLFDNLLSSVYVDKLYQQIISDAVEESMKAAVDRVKANPDCITSGEVRLKTNVIQCGYINSGLSLMHATILLGMRITPQYLVWLEGLCITMPIT